MYFWSVLATSGPEEAIGSFQPVPAADLRPGVEQSDPVSACGSSGDVL